jgi:hypothetical protein
VGYESTISGIPLISILDSNHSAVAQWFLDQQGNLLTNFSSSIFYSIEKGKKYLMNVTWDLTNIYTHKYVSSGQYEMEASIATPHAPGFSYFMPDEGSLSITITNDNPEITPTTTTTTQKYDVLTKTTLNKTSLSTGDNLTIRTEIQYSGEESTITGIPAIFIWGANGSVAQWFLDKDGNLVTGFNSSMCYQIEKGKVFIMNITWGLKDTIKNNDVPPGQYRIQVSIAEPTSGFGFTLPISNEGQFTITIS